MSALRLCSFTQILGIGALTLTVQAQDLHFKKNISVGGSPVSSTEIWVKGVRERSVTNSPTGNTTTIRQCDLKRTVTLNDQTQAYLVTSDIQDEAALKAAALLNGGQTTASAATITQTTTIADTGERKTLLGLTARHLKTTVKVESAANACSQVNQQYEIDGWYADLNKDHTSCQQSLPPVRLTDGCNDQIIAHHSGTAKPGFPLTESITLHNADGSTMKIDVATTVMPKQALTADQFDVPATYRQVNSAAELTAAQPLQAANAAMPMQQPMGNGAAVASPFGSMSAGIAQGGMMAQAQQMGMGKMMAPGGVPAGAPMPLPQALGPKAPGKIRIGIAPAQAQLGQGNDAQNDYGTPVRNSTIYLMSGPSIEIAALDSRLPQQVQAEAQQKQCDYIMMSGVTIKHSGSSGFGKFMKAGNMAASMTPIGMMAHGASGALAAAQAASTAAQVAAQQAAIQAAQQAATSQLAGLNGQIKQKDDVTVEYHLYPTGQDKSVLDNVMKGKAKTDGEDVLTPMVQQAANNVLTQVSKK
jgi:hypothetical protein